MSNVGEHAEVVIVGAGLSGLRAAGVLHAAGVPFTLIDASDQVGGRVRTDIVEGFRLDRGFQVYLTSYEEGRAAFDYAALDFKAFEPGALVFHGGRFHKLVDPWRRPTSFLEGALAKVGTLADKLRVGTMRAELARLPAEALFRPDRPERSILDALRQRGFSEAMIERFFRPFFGGIFLDVDLAGSSRMMEQVFRCFAAGDAAVPRLGMGELPRQLAARLPAGCLRLGLGAMRDEGNPSGRGLVITDVHTGDTAKWQPRVVIDAASAPAWSDPASPRAGQTTPNPISPPVAPNVTHRRGVKWRGVVNLYFTATAPPPVREPFLILDGEGAGPVTNLAFMSAVSGDYAPPGSMLASCTLIGPAWVDRYTRESGAVQAAVLAQMARWFGAAAVGSWRLLRAYVLPWALPDQRPPWYTRRDWPVQAGPGLLRAGDVADMASIDGALRSGRRAAEAAISLLRA